MKKWIAFLVAAMLAVSLAACGGSPSEGGTEPTNGSSIGVSDKQPEKQEATISETVLVDEAGVKITAKSLNTKGLFGAEVKLLIENNSSKNLTVQCRDVSVNGYMVDTILSADVANGKKANDAITFVSSDLEACGIKTIADMEFSFHIFTSDDWETYLDTDQIQLKTSAASTYEYTFDDSGETVYEENGVKVVVKGLNQKDSILGPGIVTYIENNSDRNVTVQVRNVSVNGFMVDAICSSDVMSGKRIVDSITFMSSDLEENEITDIETVELSFHIFDSDSWNGIADTDVVTLTFQ